MSMYAPNNRKGPPPGPGQQPQQCPSDAQAREKLALYVYEYLIHTGAKQSAETFLKEINWQKQISVSDAPGFLQSWWCVFWDLYCAAPERRETCEHSMEAKAFHDHGFVNSGGFLNGMHQNTAPSPIGMPPGGDGMPPGAMGPGGHPGFFPPRPSQPGPMPPASQASPISGHPPPGQPVGFPGGPRFGGPRGGPGMGPQRLPQDPNMSPFGPSGHMYVPGGHPDQLRPPGGMPLHPQRLPPSAGPMRVQGANSYPAGMRPGLAPPMPRHWQQSTSGPLHFSDPSGGQYPPGGPMMSNGPMSIPCSSAPIMSSPGPMPLGGPDGGPLVDPRYMPMGSGVAPGMPPFQMGGVDCVGPGGAPNEMLMNGEDIKNSPASTHGGLNGGTPGPGSQQNNGPHGGPGSAAPGGPGSVQSQGNNGNDSMDYSTGNQQSHGDDEQSEIAKIKQDMIQGFEPKTDGDFQFDTI